MRVSRELMQVAVRSMGTSDRETLSTKEAPSTSRHSPRMSGMRFQTVSWRLTEVTTSQVASMAERKWKRQRAKPSFMARPVKSVSSSPMVT